ncbi:cyanate transporter [Bordetella bronchiseptica]|uniref:cyanate transporter n=1 Tax=Bordetella bronchiseptica TaxID=518 RepID=UPI00028B3399|nr:cyanate transporter [Bordetella bronchiseptica]AWP57493.1 MFS transporter [Bordetella bronchiseptica]AWQ04235.1 MFS transporter [Bordetella bronchiseptica]AZW29809.1 MFS transporter [Bordetella bronchiseptica]QET68733.1 CynX/NimT family MFS transporter [Bordetella bronchiseptica]QIY01899.1 CynX/NimT family MFS transporter [Bordetella bronchiseptica]
MTAPRLGAAPRAWAMLALVALIGLNLRPFLTGPGTVLAGIEADTGLGHLGASMLTVLPMLLMGVGAFLAPAVQARVGTRRGVLAALLALALGSALRLAAWDGALLIATAALCGLGVAYIQAVFPGVIKDRFPGRMAAVMGVYSAMMMGGGALGARLTSRLAGGAGDSWRAALAWLAVPALIAFAAAWRHLAETPAARRDGALAGTLMRRPRTWLLIAAFGLVNGGYSSMVAWLAPAVQAQGWSIAQSGDLMVAMTIAQAAAALTLPALAARRPDRRPWLYATLAMQAMGFAGMAFWPAAAPLAWALIGGAGLGGCFALTFIAALDHFSQAEPAGVLAALMQGGGFLIAGLAPFAVAALRAATGGFAAGWTMHLACVAIACLLYQRLDPARYARVMAAEPGAAATRRVPSA